MHPYYQFLRLIAVFLFLSPWLQSCMPSSKRAYVPKQDELLNKATKNTIALHLPKQEAIEEMQANAQHLSPSHSLAPCFYLVASPVTITNKLFTSIGGEKMIFSQEGGECIARMITTSCKGISIAARLPVFCEQQRSAWLMLQLLGQQEQKLHKRRIHILHSKERGKYVFLGSLGLLGGMQAARKPKSVALHEAAKQGDVVVVQKLLATGADLEGLDKYGFTPLEYATWQGYAAIVKLLLDNGASPNKYTDLSYSYLHLAAIKGHLEIAKLLLEKGADVDARAVCNNMSCTPLHVAVNCGHVDIVQLLLENGAEAKLTSELGISTFDWAAQHGHLGIIKLLLAKENIVNTTADRYKKALYLAVANGQVAVVKLLLDLGADPNMTNADDTTLLHEAAEYGQLEVVELLLERGTKLNTVDKDGFTPLHLAADKGAVAVASLLLDRGADPNITNGDNCSPLHWAVYDGHLVLIDLLLDKGADLNITDIEGYSPLHVAADQGHIDVMLRLLWRKPDLNLQNSYKETFLHALLNVDNSIHDSALHPNNSLVGLITVLRRIESIHKILLDNLLDVMVNDCPSLTNDDSKIILAMIVDYAQGLNLTLKDKAGNTPLDILQLQLTEAAHEQDAEEAFKTLERHQKLGGWMLCVNHARKHLSNKVVQGTMVKKARYH